MYKDGASWQPQAIFAKCQFKQLGIDQNGRAYGQFEATGVRPSFVNRLESSGIKLPSNLFAERVLLRD